MLYRLVTTFLYFCIVISKNTIKLIHSLGTKKGREKTGLFVAEGPKVVGDLRTAGFHAEQVIEDPDDVRHASFLQRLAEQTICTDSCSPSTEFRIQATWER